MKKFFLLLLCVFIFFGSVRYSIATQSDKATVRVGVIIPLTGEFAAWGAGVRRAIELYSETNQNRFKFEFEDEGNCEAQKSLSSYRKLASSGVQFIIVGCLAGTKVILPVAKKDRVLLLSVGLMDDISFESTSQLVNLATQLSVESRYLGQRVIQRGFKRIAILHWIDPFSNEFATTLANFLRKNGSEVVIDEGVDPKDQDFRSLLLRVRGRNPDAICFNIGQDQQEVLLRQIRELGIKVPLFSNYVFETSALLKLGELVSNAEYSFPLNSSDGSASKIGYDKQFEERFGAGIKPTANSYFMHDGLVLLDQVLKKCPDASPECAASYFKSTRNFLGLSGEVSFRDDGSNERPYGIKKIEQGKFVWITP